MIRKRLYELHLAAALPSPPAVGLRVLDAARSGLEQDALERLTRLVQADGSLAARVLRIANEQLRDEHAGDTEPTSIASIGDAAARLAPEQFRALCLEFSLVRDGDTRCSCFDYESYWSEALATAVTLAELADCAGSHDPGEAWTLGLVVGVGRLALATVHPDTYSELLLDNARSPVAALLDSEREAFDITHLDVAAGLVEEWRAHPAGWVRRSWSTSCGCVAAPSRMWRRPRVSCPRRRELARVLVRSGPETSSTWSEDFPAIHRAAFELGWDPSRVAALGPKLRSTWRDWSVELRAPAPRAAEDDETAAKKSVTELEWDQEDEHTTRVLLVDDDHRILRLLEHSLRREGYEVYTAESSTAGLRMAMELLPHVVITDWIMPGISGVELCRTLRHTAVGRQMYVLIVTAHGDDDQALRAFEAGADDFIVKPFNPHILAARVRAGQRLINVRERVESSERERLRQLAELGILTRRLRDAAMTDALTGLPNRRYGIDRLKQEWASSQRDGRPLSAHRVGPRPLQRGQRSLWPRRRRRGTARNRQRDASTRAGRRSAVSHRW